MSTRKKLALFYWKVQGVIAPTLRYSQHLYEDVLKRFVNSDTRWLDLGCGHQILPSWREKEEKRLVESCELIVGIDYDLYSLTKHKNLSLKVRGDISKLPFKDNYFDLVTANMVVEHLERPDNQFREIKRILKPGGVFIFHTPNVFGYVTVMSRLIPEALKGKLINLLEGRKEEDVFQTYYRANTRKDINGLAKEIGVEVVEIKMLVTDAISGVIPPLVVLELIWIKMLMANFLKPLRTNIIAILKKV